MHYFLILLWYFLSFLKLESFRVRLHNKQQQYTSYKFIPQPNFLFGGNYHFKQPIMQAILSYCIMKLMPIDLVMLFARPTVMHQTVFLFVLLSMQHKNNSLQHLTVMHCATDNAPNPAFEYFTACMFLRMHIRTRMPRAVQLHDDPPIVFCMCACSLPIE